MAETANGFVVGGTASGVGKTTVTLALIAALRKRGYAVQSFKCGPDFIDGGHHARACGRPSRNLDGWMLSCDVNRQIFYRGAKGADVSVVEGVMGLFDGVDGASEAGSTAETAKLLRLPVVLVADASQLARSAAALIKGFETFDPKLRVAGVVLNRVAGPTHYRLLREAIESSCQATLLGYLPGDERIRIPERYLGLFTASEDVLPDSVLTLLGDLAATHINLEKLKECASAFTPETEPKGTIDPQIRVRVGVARDRAFCFYYEDNFDALRAAGAEIVEFSPLRDQSLPEDVDALYFGGGYPELYAEELAANHLMLGAIKRFVDLGRPIYAECGGLMYLANQIVMRDKKVFAMAGVLPLDVQMTERLVKFGYAEVLLTENCMMGPKGARARGHSFHCSMISRADHLDRVYHLRYSLSGQEETEGFRVRNVLASYIHLHFLSNPGLATRFVEHAQSSRHAHRGAQSSC
jgi:cobyrinic acid a,c-diamide synthase